MCPTATGARAGALPTDQRRSMIVAATLPLLIEHGDRLTTKQVAEAAGIAEGTIFRVFATKDDLVAAAVDAALDPAPLESALAAIPEDAPFAEALVAAIGIIQQRVLDVWRLMSGIGTKFYELAHRPVVDSEALVRLFEMHRARLTVEPVVAARLLRALTLSSTHPMLIGEAMPPDTLARFFLHGIGREDGPC